MPSNVKDFAVLCYLSLLLGIAASVFTFQENAVMAARVGGAAFIIIVQVFTFGFLALLFWLIAFRHQNWARWLLLVMFVLGLPFALIALPAQLSASPIKAGASIVQTVLQAVALYLVFTGNAKEWFRKTTTPSASLRSAPPP